MKFAVAALLGLMSHTVNSTELPAGPEYVQSKVVREEMAQQLLELDGSLSEKELVQMMKWPRTFEDSYVAMKTKSKAKRDDDANGTDSGSEDEGED